MTMRAKSSLDNEIFQAILHVVPMAVPCSKYHVYADVGTTETLQTRRELDEKKGRTILATDQPAKVFHLGSSGKETFVTDRIPFCP